MRSVRRNRGAAARRGIGCVGLLALALGVAPDVGAVSFIEFESGLVRPLALTPDGTRLLAVNTPDDRLQIFSVAPSGLSPLTYVHVGIHPLVELIRSNYQ